VWLKCVPHIQKITSDVVDFIHIFEMLDVDHTQFVATVARQIWLRRNTINFCSDFLDPTSLI
jgi:hypothetical protein